LSGIPDDFKIHIDPLNLSGGIGLGLSGGLALDAGLDDIQIKATGDPAKPLSLHLGLDPLDIKIEPLDIKLEPIRLTLDPLDIKIEPLRMTLDPLKVDLGLDNVNVCLSLAFTQFPRMQVHMPKKYDFGFSLLGVPIVSYSICGESSYITDDNPPRWFQKAHPESSSSSAAPSAPPSKASPHEPYKVVLP
jgi:hypothetical protein